MAEVRRRNPQVVALGELRSAAGQHGHQAIALVFGRRVSLAWEGGKPVLHIGPLLPGASNDDAALPPESIAAEVLGPSPAELGQPEYRAFVVGDKRAD